MDPNASSAIFKPRIIPNMVFLQRNTIFLTFLLLLVLKSTSTSALSVASYLKGEMIRSQTRSLETSQSYFLDYNMTGHHALIEMSNSFISNASSSIVTDYCEAECCKGEVPYAQLERSECNSDCSHFRLKGKIP